MITLGIDPSLTGLGWCVHNGGVVGAARVIAKGWISTPREQIDYLRYMFLREAVGRSRPAVSGWLPARGHVGPGVGLSDILIFSVKASLIK